MCVSVAYTSSRRPTAAVQLTLRHLASYKAVQRDGHTGGIELVSKRDFLRRKAPL